jgi:ABC-type antimicrobial peptide transport system permease subunit
MVSTGLIGLGTFLVVAVGLNQRNANSDLSMRSSPTGGFEYYGTSTISIIEDLASPDGRDEYGLGEEEFRDIEILSFRTSGGEDASCLNLNRAQRPSILGVKPNELDNLKTFSFHSVVEQVDPNHPWLALSMLKGDNTIPAVVDQSSAQWALGLKLGDTYEFEKENGETINLEIVGLVNQSILQGSILISDENFQSIFPSISGYRAFLIDTPVDDKMQLSSLLERRFEKVGLDLVPTSQRLSEFQSVENTYLSIFLVLGGLGLALGCLSLGIVLLRNILERRAEFSLLAAIGFTKKRIQYLIFIEHCWLLLVGVLLGTVAGIISVWPIVQSRATQLPLFTLCILLIIIMASGLGSVYLSTLAAHRKLDTKVLQSE